MTSHVLHRAPLTRNRITAGHGMRRESRHLSSQIRYQSQDFTQLGAQTTLQDRRTNLIRSQDVVYQPDIFRRHFSVSSDLGDTQPEAIEQIQQMVKSFPSFSILANRIYQGFSRVPDSATQDTQLLDHVKLAAREHLLGAASTLKPQDLPTFPPYTQELATFVKKQLLQSKDMSNPPFPATICQCDGPNNLENTVNQRLLYNTWLLLTIFRSHVYTAENRNTLNAMAIWRMNNRRHSCAISVFL
jgi:hypothetical protein